VYGLFGFSFYEMLQPRHIANLGLAAYKPPLATGSRLRGGRHRTIRAHPIPAP
jgi:hypothetical protein